MNGRVWYFIKKLNRDSINFGEGKNQKILLIFEWLADWNWYWMDVMMLHSDGMDGQR